MRAFTLAVKLLVMLALPLAVGTTFLSNTLAGFFGAEFLPHGAVAISIMAWSMVAGWINSVTNYALIAVNQQRTITRAFAATLVFNLAANLIFVPLFSYQAAAVVTIGSEILKGAIFYYYVRRHIGALHWSAIMARPALAAGLMAAAAGGGAWLGAPLAGLVLGTLLYAAALVALRSLDEQERAVLGPLLRRR
jgi:O-antigen/teichoic acid export membrane protein